MRLIKGSVAGLVLAGVLTLLPAAAIARGGGGGHFGGGHFGEFAGHGFAFHHAGHFGRRGFFWDGDPFSYDYPYYGYAYEGDGGYPAGQVPAGPRFSSAPQT